MSEDAKLQGFAPELNAIAEQYKSFGPELWRLLRRLNEQMMLLSNQSKILEAGENITLTDFPRKNTTRISAESGGADLLETFLTVDAESGLVNSRQATAGPGIQITDNGALGTFVIETQPGYVFIERRVAYVTWSNNTVLAQQAFGDFLTYTGGGQTNVAPTATEEAMGRHPTNNVIGNNGGLNGNLFWMFGLDFDVYFRVRLNMNTQNRCWLAMSDTALATILGGDTGGTWHIAGFRNTSGVGASNWKSVTQVGTASFEEQDTGVAVDLVNSQLFQISYRGSTGYVTFYINGTQVSQHTTFIPTAVMGFRTGVKTLEAVIKSLDIARIYEETRRPIP